ncbi:efflux RND transporter permease subunit [Calycomorphotria hydatis]|uniref:Multidrug resistance protein MdtB n=1 Tax=Calycomorphotria hydatis TaxID=2528027 RepID=A0A517TB58_9PLAN|nr:efflux RND transporter permease subunit [Calycomorphotria hydatis]QDT65608.1 Multidrug resistance protein MdtB [Calycomorphotria hydatis]
MNLIRGFVTNPVKVAVGVLLVVLFGSVALTQLPMQLIPEVQTPTITVKTNWPGASPQEVEREIIIEQEEQLKSVEGLRKLSSESSDSQGTITMEFLVGTDLDRAIVNVISRLEQVRDYPEDADKPVIETANANDRPIAWFILSPEFPTDEELATFQEKHGRDQPKLYDGIQRVRDSFNPGLKLLRLRKLQRDYPEVKELLPPEDLDVTKLRRFAEDEIEARFERVEGVSQSNVLGGLEDELQVVVDPEKLAARQLTITDVRNVLRGQNDDVSGGDYWEGKRRYVVRTLGQFRSPLQVEEQLLAVRDGQPVYVRDVATVSLGYKKPDGFVRRYGESSIAINAQRETGANVIDVMHGLHQVNMDLNVGLLKDRGLTLTQVYDETEYIDSSVKLVRQNIFIGGALTMIVLTAFLHLGVRALIVIPAIAITAVASATISPYIFILTLAIIITAGFAFSRGALVVGLAIPTSIIGTFLILQGLGRSLNVISLAGMAFAVGMLVDNAVVVLENIYRRYQGLGERPFDAAVNGTAEVWGAVLSSTLTTIAVFLPIVFVEQEAGQLFRDIAIAISGAVALSLIISITLIPTLSARLLMDRKSVDIDGLASEGKKTRSPHWWERILIDPLKNGGHLFVTCVVSINNWIQRSWLRRVSCITVLLVATFVGIWLLWPKVEYLPTGNRNLVFGILLPPPGYNIEELNQMGDTVEKSLRPYWDIDPNDPKFDELDYPAVGDFFYVARNRSVFLGLRAYEPMKIAGLVPLVQKVGATLPGTFAVAKQSSLFEQGLAKGRTIEIEITGPELPKLVQMGGQVFGMAQQLIPGAQIRPVPSLDLSSPELHVDPKLLQMAEVGFNSVDLGYTVDALVDGAYAGDYYLEGDKIDLRIIGKSGTAESSQDVKALPIATPQGHLVPLMSVANVDLSSGPEQINHRERERAITIEVSPPPEMALEDAMLIISTQIVEPLKEQGVLSGPYRITLAGTADKLQDAWKALRFNVILALLITYLLMAALFESWVYPFVIILSVPLGAVGGLMGLKLLNLFYLQPLDVLTMLGFVVLIGTVVNNPILIVHQSLNLIREEDMPPRLAIVESIRTRVRPIFMTTLTTVLGLLPLVMFPGAGSELYRGLGSVVLGGLLVSTIFTLFLVPTIFRVMLDITEWLWGQSTSAPGQLTSKVEDLDAEVLDAPMHDPQAEKERPEVVAGVESE